MNMLSQSQLRNTMNKEDHEPEYLLCAKLHDDDFDDRGYVTTLWTTVTMLKTLQEPPAALAGHLKSFQTDAQTAFDAATGGHNRL
jgi:hypothetical protein